MYLYPEAKNMYITLGRQVFSGAGFLHFWRDRKTQVKTLGDIPSPPRDLRHCFHLYSPYSPLTAASVWAMLAREIRIREEFSSRLSGGTNFAKKIQVSCFLTLLMQISARPTP